MSRLIGTASAPVLIDVRIDTDFDADPQALPTVLRHSFEDIASLAPTLKNQRVVIYCQKGKMISQGAAAILKAKNLHCETLEGGHFAWRDSGLPSTPTSKVPDLNSDGHTVWVTKQCPKIDCIACPWLICRFIDPKAQFLFVEPSQVHAVAEKFNATPFDVNDVFWGHLKDRCTFDVMTQEFELETPALLHLALIIRGADTNQLDLTPESAGLVAASLGLSRMYRDDVAQLNAGMLLYDAFYRWARDAINENHDTSFASQS